MLPVPDARRGSLPSEPGTSPARGAPFYWREPGSTYSPAQRAGQPDPSSNIRSNIQPSAAPQAATDTRETTPAASEAANPIVGAPSDVSLQPSTASWPPMPCSTATNARLAWRLQHPIAAGHHHRLAAICPSFLPRDAAAARQCVSDNPGPPPDPSPASHDAASHRRT